MLREHSGGVTLEVKVKPGSKITGLFKESGGGLTIRVKARATEGKANAEVVARLSKLFRLPKSRISFLRGETGRKKLVLLEGLSYENALALLEAEFPQIDS